MSAQLQRLEDEMKELKEEKTELQEEKKKLQEEKKELQEEKKKLIVDFQNAVEAKNLSDIQSRLTAVENRLTAVENSLTAVNNMLAVNQNAQIELMKLANSTIAEHLEESSDNVVVLNNLARCKALRDHRDDMDACLGLLYDIAVNETLDEEEVAQYCYPQRRPYTWGADRLKTNLEEAMGKLCMDPASLAPRVIGLVSGCGNGKTHALLEMPKLLECDNASVYITYNLGQDTGHDERTPRECILFRVLLASVGLRNKTATRYIAEGALDGWPAAQKDLFAMVVAKLRQTQKNKRFVVCVDECRNLITKKNENAVRQIASVLGDVAKELHTVGIQCVVIMSCLAIDCLVSHSERPISWLRLPHPDETTRRFIYNQCAGDHEDHPIPDHHDALLAASAGFHMRSMVLASELLRSEKVNCDIDALWLHMKDRIRHVFSDPECVKLQEFLCNSPNNHLPNDPTLEPYLDSQRAACPAIVWATLGPEHAGTMMLRTSLFIDAPKQLEHCGYQYDRFRRGTFVIPVPCHEEFRATNIEATVITLTQMRFPDTLVLREKSLFKTTRVSVVDDETEEEEVDGSTSGELDDERNATRSKVLIQRTTFTPKFGDYIFPKDTSHPLVDRAVVVKHPENREETCLVLYQDKLARGGALSALKALKQAYDLMKSEFKTILCIAHVVDSGKVSPAAAAILSKVPHLIITSSTLSKFYAPTFLPAIKFLRQRQDVCVPLKVNSMIAGDKRKRNGEEEAAKDDETRSRSPQDR